MYETTCQSVLKATSCALIIGLLLLGVGCKSIGYGAWKMLGYDKRHLLVENVEEARDSQEEAKEQFKTALEKFSSVVNFDGGELEAKYKELNSAYERSLSRAEAVSKRIASVEGVAGDLFAEWENELNEYSDGKLRRLSAEQLETTKDRYQQLVGAMRKAESRMPPVLDRFKDQVLFLRHHLNAQAISSLKNELTEIEDEVSDLVKEMEAAVGEANAFIAQMNQDTA